MLTHNPQKRRALGRLIALSDLRVSGLNSDLSRSIIALRAAHKAHREALEHLEAVRVHRQKEREGLYTAFAHTPQTRAAFQSLLVTLEAQDDRLTKAEEKVIEAQNHCQACQGEVDAVRVKLREAERVAQKRRHLKEPFDLAARRHIELREEAESAEIYAARVQGRPR